MRLEHLTVLNQERAARRAVVLVTDLVSGQQKLIKGEDVPADPGADILGRPNAHGQKRAGGA